MSFDPLAQLTIQELDAASRRVKTDVATAIATGTMDRWRAMAAVAHMIALRTDPAAKFADFMAMLPAELTVALGYPAEDEETDPDQDQKSVSANESADDVGGDDGLAALGGSLAPDQLGAGQDSPASGGLDAAGGVELDPTAPTHA